MNVYLACALLVTVVAGEAPAESGPYPAASGPYPPSGWRPSGPLLMLPARQQVSTVYGPPPPSEYGVPTATYGPPSTEPATEAETTEPTSEAPADEEATESTDGESEQLRDSGVYYVLMQDGRLQMVRYRTAPLRKAPSSRFTDVSKNSKSQRASQIQAHQAQFQTRPAKLQQQPAQFNQQATRSNKQFNGQTAQFNQRSAQIKQQPQPFHYVEIQKSHEIEVAQPPAEVPSNGFFANLQYRNVEPISAPVFVYNPAPLTRILKK